MTRASLSICVAAIGSVVLLAPSFAAAQEFTLTIKDHVFTPAEITIPANKRVQVTVINADATPEEFESHPLKVEKVVPGNSKAVVRIGPVKPGRYPFVGEFHESTAKGTVIAK